MHQCAINKKQNNPDYHLNRSVLVAPPAGLRLVPVALACVLRPTNTHRAHSQPSLLLGFLGSPRSHYWFSHDNKKRHPLGVLFVGSSSWARTSDIMINSHALYRLSYRGILVFSWILRIRFFYRRISIFCCGAMFSMYPFPSYIQTKRTKSIHFIRSFVLVPAAFYLPGQLPAKYCRR